MAQRFTLPEEHCRACGIWLGTGDTTQQCYDCLAAEIERLRAALVELGHAALLSYYTVDAVSGDEVLQDMRQLVLRLRAEGLLPPE